MSVRNYRYQSETKLESQIPVSGLEGIMLFSGEIFLGVVQVTSTPRRQKERGKGRR